MIRYCPLVLALLLFGSAYSTAQLPTTGSSLQRWLQESNAPGSPQELLIVYAHQVDHAGLQARMDASKVRGKDRARMVIRECMQVAAAARQALMADLSHHNLDGFILNARHMWILNATVLSTDRQVARWLMQRPDIAFIDLNRAWMARPLDAPRPGTGTTRSPGGIEPGLAAVNAPALWAMGYTGRNRISFSIDTGVWPDHPAISDRFLANFFPMSQSWYAYDFPDPADKAGSHGTHTLGTTLGLEKATQDTIGVAFNAYWIASDPVATSLATVKPLSDFMFAFQWGMNPDGDTTTTWDVPDVINNSWGYDSPGDTALCQNSFVSQVFDAVHTAGIANVFSAGNDGPGVGSISEPHHIANGLVNTFTVGAVNAHQPGYPIASFSSRGPTNCPATGSLLIKPEVAAPGVNVRSAVGNSGYANYQGTSMAAPHVTGVILLLKEAFPMVSGEEIMEALYYSATDLGTPGEDNDYGMGMIDALSAFNYLAISHTPVPPVGPGPDITISEILEPQTDFQCDSLVAPVFVLENRGDSTLNSAQLSYELDSAGSMNFSWSGALAPGGKDTVYLPAMTVTSQGSHTVKVRIQPLTSEIDTLNNHRQIRFRTPVHVIPPLSEDFESILPPTDAWMTINRQSDGIAWDTAYAGGLAGSQSSMVMRFFNFGPRAHQEDDLLSPEVALPSTGPLYLSFDVAYQYRGSIFRDSLLVYASTDCRTTWDKIYSKGGTGLSTWPNTVLNWTPWTHQQWRTEVVDLSAYTGQGNLHLRFTAVNSSGNNLFLDNVNVAPAPVLSAPQAPHSAHLNAFPNPSGGRVSVRWEGHETGYQLEVRDLLGRMLQQYRIKSAEAKIDLSALTPGMYLIRVADPSGTESCRVLRR